MTLDPGSADQLRSTLATVAAVPVTPFGPDGQVDWEAHDRVIRRMVDAGVRLVTPNGNTGEFYALTAAEARRATESAVAATAGSGAGLAELTAPACWTAGARGFTSGLVNVAPALSLSMVESLRGGDMAGAMKAWEDCRAFEELRAADSSANNVSVVKEALAQLGLCRPDVRPPSHRVPEEVRTQITEILESWGLPVSGQDR